MTDSVILRVVYAKKIKEIHIENENTGFLL